MEPFVIIFGVFLSSVIIYLIIRYLVSLAKFLVFHAVSEKAAKIFEKYQFGDDIVMAVKLTNENKDLIVEYSRGKIHIDFVKPGVVVKTDQDNEIYAEIGFYIVAYNGGFYSISADRFEINACKIQTV